MPSSTHTPSWRRNHLPFKQRFQSPLYLHFSPHQPVVYSTQPLDASFSIVYSVTQDKETANALWDICTAMCGYFIYHSHTIFSHLSPDPILNIIELGAGTGLLGMVAGKEWSRSHGQSIHLVITDLPQELDTIRKNVLNNFKEARLDSQGVLHDGSLTISIQPLTWGSHSDYQAIIHHLPHQPWFHVVIASDIVYELQYFDYLFTTLDDIATSHPTSDVLFLMGTEHRWRDVDALWWQGMVERGWTREQVMLTPSWWNSCPELEIMHLTRSVPSSDSIQEEEEEDINSVIQALKQQEYHTRFSN